MILYIHHSYSFICYSDISFHIYNMDSFNWHARLNNSDKLKRTLTLQTLTSLLPQLWHAHFHNWYACTTLTYSLLKLWHAWSHCSDMLSLTSLAIWLLREQAGSGGSGFASRGKTGFAGSKLVAVGTASLVAVKLPSPVVVDPASLVALALDSLEARWLGWLLLCW